ncbi:DUF3592 domain-containing protein [Actinoplanes sp. M2I2]|uniref:DUF3592 domain-containing protein n=1 Tax=Actinoplanes sp. M2I2 TaxID=1734444 RepID=UPI002020751C|nr:DUF3592 domain-containing protein [Actinoplanes sp. M2I2]
MDSGVLVLVTGVVLDCVGIVQFWRIGKRRRTSVASVGTVVGHDESHDDGTLYAPVIAFVDEDGAARRFTPALRSSRRMHQVGQEVPVTYPPGRPDAPRLSSLTHNALLAGLPLAFGAVFTVFGLFGLLQG